MTSPGYRLQLLENSDLAQTLLLSMAALENQPDIKFKLLQTLQFLSSSSGQYLIFKNRTCCVYGRGHLLDMSITQIDLLH